MAAQALIRLGHLLGDTNFLDAAHNTLIALWGEIERAPAYHNALLAAVEETVHPTQTIVLRGTLQAMQSWIDHGGRRYAPRRITVAIPGEAKDLPGILAQRTTRDGVTAYVCSGHACEAPVTDFAIYSSQVE